MQTYKQGKDPEGEMFHAMRRHDVGRGVRGLTDSKRVKEAFLEEVMIKLECKRIRSYWL